MFAVANHFELSSETKQLMLLYYPFFIRRVISNTKLLPGIVVRHLTKEKRFQGLLKSTYFLRSNFKLKSTIPYHQHK